ncbi:MAG: VWA domain-containing protein [Candidatus Sabulitectum sp.]|nr:VWA domain-containing protein [Candidatus Sabulitectum sp.]
MEFQRPWMIIFALAGPLYWWLRLRWLRDDEKRLRRFVRPVLWERMGIIPPAQHRASRLLISVAIMLLSLSAAGPVWGVSAACIPSGGENVVIALDVSRSMWSDDEAPTRLGRSAIEIKRLIRSMPGTRFSLVLFSGHARLAVPITLDNDFILDRIPSGPADEVSLPQGTALSNLVDVMAAALPDMDMEGQVGIIFSDGGFHDYTLNDAINEALSRRMALVTVGTGGDSPVTVPGDNGPLVWQGDTVKTVLEEEWLQKLAVETGGFYTRVSEAGDLSRPVNELLHRSFAQADAEIAGAAGARRYQYFLGAALLLMVIAAGIERRES